MRQLAFAIGMLLAATPAMAAERFAWLVGNWCEQTKGALTCEHWAPVAGGLMKGGGTTNRAGELIESEITIIRFTPNGAVYDATPAGAATVPFAEVERGPQSVTFENRAHDYPQRIHYWREGPDLWAEISFVDSSKLLRWHYRRAR